MPISQVEAPNGAYHDLAWLQNGMLVFSYSGRQDTTSGRLWVFRSDGATLTPIDLPHAGEDCLLSRFHKPRPNFASSVAFISHCIRKGTPDPGYIAKWDPITGASERLFDYAVPNINGDFTFNPKSQLVLYSTDVGTSDKLFVLSEAGATELDVGLDKAKRPSWSPDGNSIAFFGNRNLSGGSGDWIGKPADLWLMPAICLTASGGGCTGELESVIKDIGGFGTISWSPDSRWLAFDGKPGGYQNGIWLYEPAIDSLTQIARGEFSSPRWSPDGKRIIVSGSDPVRGGVTSALYILDVSVIVTGN